MSGGLREIDKRAQDASMRKSSSVLPSSSTDSPAVKTANPLLPATEISSSKEGTSNLTKIIPQNSVSKGGKDSSESEEGALANPSAKRKTSSSDAAALADDMKKLRNSSDLKGATFLFGDAVSNYKWMRHNAENYDKIRNLFWCQRAYFERFILTVAVWPAPRIDQLFGKLLAVSGTENVSVKVAILEEEIKVYLAEMKNLIEKNPNVNFSGWFKKQESLVKTLWQQDEPSTIEFNLPETFICKSTPTSLK